MSDKQSPFNKSPGVGTMLGQYRLEELIASGGMARIYKAVDTNLERTVAVKILMPELIELDDTLIDRFEREAKAVAQLEHDNIVRIYDYRRQEDSYYIVMNYIEGHDLADELNQLRRENKLMEISKALPLLAQVAGALDFAHAAGIIHRDVKPSNVLMTKSGKAILTDFGLVLRQSIDKTLGTAFGTPRYIAPEQALASENSVPQSDIYSLAVITYEMLTGQMLFFSENPMQIAMSHINDRPTPPRSINPGIPLAAEREILKALSKRPVERHRSASEFISSLKKAYREMAMSLKDMPSGQTSQQTLVLSDEDNSRELLKQAFDQNVQATQMMQPVQTPPNAEAARPTTILTSEEIAAREAQAAAALLASWDDPVPSEAAPLTPISSSAASTSQSLPVVSPAPVTSSPAKSTTTSAAAEPPAPSIPSVLPSPVPANRTGQVGQSSNVKSTAEAKSVKPTSATSRQRRSVFALVGGVIVALALLGAITLMNNPSLINGGNGEDINGDPDTVVNNPDENPALIAQAMTLPPVTSVPATPLPELAAVEGQPVSLEYNDHVLVLRNASDAALDVSSLELAMAGSTAAFAGSRIQDSSVPASRCVGIAQSGHAFNPRDWDCAGSANYDVLEVGGQQLFWRTTQPGQFIVRQNGTPIAYCPTIQRGAEQTCEFNLPVATGS
jgi:serine/threonine protein kinase